MEKRGRKPKVHFDGTNLSQLKDEKSHKKQTRSVGFSKFTCRRTFYVEQFFF